LKKEITTYYDQLANNYDTDRFANSYGKYINKQENKIVRKYLSPNHIKNNLDIACGTGRFLLFADFGVDISKKMVTFSKAKFSKKNIQIADAENLPFKNNAINNALSFHLFMHLDLKQVKNIANEVHHVLNNDGLFIFDIPSKKRRKLTNYTSSGWHGANQASKKDILNSIEDKWNLVNYYGIAFFPIHRIPFRLRKYFIWLDTFLCNSIFKEYSSHLIFILKKK